MEKVEIPDYLKNITDESAKDMVSIGGSVPRISIRGRQFRFIEDGDEVERTADPIDVIIIGIVPKSKMAKTFYINGYQPGSNDPPDCSSFFGEVPDSWVESPQARTCQECEQNKWGSATSMSGKKAKACKDSKRLMVVKAQDVAKGDDDYTVYIFNVTIASLKALTEYGKFLLSNNLPNAAVITRIEFVDADFPQVEFKFVAVLNEQIGTKMLEHAVRAPWLEDQPKALAAPVGKRPRAITSGKVDDNPPPPDDNDVPIRSDKDVLENW